MATALLLPLLCTRTLRRFDGTDSEASIEESAARRRSPEVDTTQGIARGIARNGANAAAHGRYRHLLRGMVIAAGPEGDAVD
jgi:hypothetical protein